MHPKRPLTIGLLALAILGIALRAYTLSRLTRADLCGSDFPIFYAAGQLAGTPQLYSAAAVRSFELRETGCSEGPALVVRLPYFAALMAPWTRLPLWPAFLLWRLAAVAVTLIFVWLWPAPRAWSLLACAWSLPLAFDITIGQDSAFLLLWFALAGTLFARRNDFAAGLILSMCTVKFHLFLLLPLLLLRRRRAVWGAIVGGGFLLCVCFAVQGPHWIGQFLGAIRSPSINPNPSEFFNLWGIAHGNTVIEILLAIPVIGAVVYISRRADLQLTMAAILAGGILLSHHVTASDLVLLIPVALTVASQPSLRYVKPIAIFLVTPPAYFLAKLPGLWDAPRLMLLAMVLLLAWEVSRLATESPHDTTPSLRERCPHPVRA
jgi:hypothetical protein